ncbi:farnesyl diphosphate synthase [Desulfovibrio aminophilus]|uniref:polyprenyl synthetase family protein n=1 Tax=Desulfovibrio aminophilus TaxID=81425 RepID=UPI0033964C79
MTIKRELAGRADEVERFLASCLRGRGIPERLLASMEYSLLAGGKRLRPVLTLSWARVLGGDPSAVLPFASGLECIHTYSLIHDDLPAMDDDDLRRGKPSNHKAFDEATAILAGDGLLTEAFGFFCDAGLAGGLPPERVLRATGLVAEAAGAAGMVGGQALDMEYTGRAGVTLEELRGLHARKTGALISVACRAGAVLAGAPEADEARAQEYGRNLGVAFQIMDDVLDLVADEATLGKPVGSDVEKGKNTYPALVGLDESRRLAARSVDRALECLAPYPGEESAFLAGLARYILERAS